MHELKRGSTHFGNVFASALRTGHERGCRSRVRTGLSARRQEKYVAERDANNSQSSVRDVTRINQESYSISLPNPIATCALGLHLVVQVVETSCYMLAPPSAGRHQVRTVGWRREVECRHQCDGMNHFGCQQSISGDAERRQVQCVDEYFSGRLDAEVRGE